MTVHVTTVVPNGKLAGASLLNATAEASVAVGGVSEAGVVTPKASTITSASGMLLITGAVVSAVTVAPKLSPGGIPETCWLKSSPHTTTEPSACNAKAKPAPAAMETTFAVAGLVRMPGIAVILPPPVVIPATPTVPSDFKYNENRLPAAIAVTPVKPAGKLY